MFYYIYFLVRALNVSHCSFYFTKMNKSLLKLSTLKKSPKKQGRSNTFIFLIKPSHP